MSKLSKSILETIKREKVKPTPKWVFLLKRSVVWGLFAASVLIGSVALGLILFQIEDADYASFHQMGRGSFEFIALALPYFWILLMGGFVALAFYHYRHTEGGYKTGVFAIVGLSLTCSLTLGFAFHASGLTEKLDRLLTTIPQYERLNFGKRMLWQRPDQGFLSGTILLIEENNVIVLQDFGSQRWNVRTEKARISPRAILEPGERIKAVGEKMDPIHFNAEFIAPWMGGRRRAPPPPPFPPAPFQPPEELFRERFPELPAY